MNLIAQPQELKSWGILVCSPRRKLQREHLTKFFDMLIETAQSKGMRIVNRPLEAYASPETVLKLIAPVNLQGYKCCQRALS